LGRTTPFTRLPAPHSRSFDPRQTWVYWYFRAIVREADLVAVHFTPEYLDKQRQFLLDEWIGDPAHPSPRSQLVYQQNNKHLAKHMAHRLHWIGISLFVLAALACVVHLIVDFGEWSPEWLRRLLTFFAAVFPAFGAAVGAIGSQAEFS